MDDATMARVYGAAVAAAADRETAADATVRAFAAAGDTGADPERLAATAVRLALRAAPAPAFAAMAAADAEAVALCRLLQVDAPRAGDLLGVAVPEVLRRLTRGLASGAAARRASRTPPPRLCSAGEACPAGGGRAS